MMRGWRGVLCGALMLACRTAKADPPKRRTEVDGFPVLGGTSDVGFGGGAIGAIERHEPGYARYKWRLSGGSLTMFKPGRRGAGGHLTYQDYYLRLSVPNLAGGIARLEARASYTRQAPVHYYGIGNASVQRPRGQLHAATTTTRASTPPCGSRCGLRSADRSSSAWATATRRTGTASDLARSWRKTSPRPIARSARSSAARATPRWIFFEYALLYDTRDDELEPRSGQYHKFQVRFSPGGSSICRIATRR